MPPPSASTPLVCRICRIDENPVLGPLLRPCACADPVHGACLRHWMAMSRPKRTSCEVCLETYRSKLDCARFVRNLGSLVAFFVALAAGTTLVSALIGAVAPLALSWASHITSAVPALAVHFAFFAATLPFVVALDGRIRENALVLAAYVVLPLMVREETLVVVGVAACLIFALGVTLTLDHWRAF